MTLQEMTRELTLLEGGRDELASMVSELETILEDKRKTVELDSKAKKLIEYAIVQRTNNVAVIEEVVSLALTEVFGNFSVKFERVEGRDGSIKGLRIKLKDGDGEYDDPLTSFGASAVSVISLVLRLTVLLLCPRASRILIADEPVAHLPTDLQRRFNKFLSTVVERTGVQLIFITHGAPLDGKVYRVRKIGGVSKVEEIENDDTV